MGDSTTARIVAVWTARLAVIAVLALLVAGAAWATGTVSGQVRERSGDPLVGAIIRAPGSDQQTTSDAEGRYSLSIPAGNQRVVAIAVGFSPAGQTVSVSDSLTTELDFELEPALSQYGESIVVIGSRSERTAIETAVPVDVITAEDLEDSGQTETARMIQFLAPSFNHSTSTISDGTDIVRPSTLRGLGPDQTLVLVNGRRRHTSALVHVNGSIGRGTAGVDLNAIPAAAIQQVEVLRDGAAAQYGSDAIAGVINLQLNRSTGETKLELSGGQHYEADGETFVASINRGWEIGDGGFINATFEYRDRGYTNRAGLDQRRIFNYEEQIIGQPELTDSDGDGLCDAGSASVTCTVNSEAEDNYDRLNHRYGDASSKNYYLFLNSEIPIGDDSTFYFFGGYSDRDGESAGFNRLARQDRTNIFFYPEGHLPLINTAVTDASLSVGFRNNFTDTWNLDASVTYGANQFNFDISNSANTSLGAESPTSADAGTLGFGQVSANLDFFGAVEWGSIPVAVALGAEYRQDNYEIEEGVDASWIDGGALGQFGDPGPAGIQVFPGFQPTNAVDEDRDNIAVYVDLELDFTDKFLMGIAGRFEDYSDFGDNFSGKIALRYAFTKKFALRGSASTGFRAPSLHQSHFNNVSTQFVDVNGTLQPQQTGTFQVDSEVAGKLGAVPLEAETSVSYSGGFTWRPMRNLSITGDAFSIDIDDRVVLSGQLSTTNPDIDDLFMLLGIDADSVQFFTNAIDTSTTGADLVVAYSIPLGIGSLSLTGAANWASTDLEAVRTSELLEDFGETLYDDREQTLLEFGQPRESYNLAGRYQRGHWAALLRFNKFGAVTSTEVTNGDPSRKQTFSSKWLTDVDFSYSWDFGLQLSVGANNVFDVFPDEQIAANSFGGIFAYPRRTAPFGFNGGYYYTRLTYSF